MDRHVYLHEKYVYHESMESQINKWFIILLLAYLSKQIHMLGIYHDMAIFTVSTFTPYCCVA
jgi:hypothetical protein